MIICSKCGRDIDAIWQDNVGYDVPLCEDCAGINQEYWEDEEPVPCLQSKNFIEDGRKMRKPVSMTVKVIKK